MSTFNKLLTAANTIEENNLHKNEKIPDVIAAFKKCYDLQPSNQESKRKYLSYFKRQFELEHIKKNQEELKVLGNAQVQQDRYEEAVIIYNASIDLDPSIESAAPIYSNRSLAFFNLGRFKEAEDDACMAIFLKPEFARGYLRRGNAAMKLEKWKESLEAFEKYFELDLENAKSDRELVNNKKLVQRANDRNEAETRRHENMIEKTRQELMAIEDETKRDGKATSLMYSQLRNPNSFDGDLGRLAVVFGANLAPFVATGAQYTSDDFISTLFGVLQTRSRVSPKILPQLDDLLFFVIDEMVRRDIAFCGYELSVACSRLASPLNPKIVRVLLETNKFDVNQIFRRCGTPLISLVEGLMDVDEVPSEALDCLHVLLNWKGIDVNAIWRRGAGDSMTENHVLDFVRHPEIARILIRHGANVNQVTASKGGTNVTTFRFVGDKTSNVLYSALTDPFNPNQEELVQLYVRSGARLLANGKDGKSTGTIALITQSIKHSVIQQRATVSEEVLRIILQLNQQQGLLCRFQDPITGDDFPVLHLAISGGSSARIVQILCAMNPEQMKEVITYRQQVISIVETFVNRIGSNCFSFEESMEVLGVLLENGFDLFEQFTGVSNCFVACWLKSKAAKCDLNLLERTIVEKRGEEEFRRCMESLTSVPASELKSLRRKFAKEFETSKKK